VRSHVLERVKRVLAAPLHLTTAIPPRPHRLRSLSCFSSECVWLRLTEDARSLVRVRRKWYDLIRFRVHFAHFHAALFRRCRMVNGEKEPQVL
jgi:hypothetical protein